MLLVNPSFHKPASSPPFGAVAKMFGSEKNYQTPEPAVIIL
jgi:hypothetical protein